MPGHPAADALVHFLEYVVRMCPHDSEPDLTDHATAALTRPDPAVPVTTLTPGPEGGSALAEVHVTGANGYTFTAGMMAWAAHRAADGAITATGALAPVEAFGLRELEAGAAEAGIAAAKTPAPTAEVA